MSCFTVTALTLFPDMFPGPLGLSLAGKALQEKKWALQVVNLHDYAQSLGVRADDSPFGGGAGMVLRADVIEHALKNVKHSLKRHAPKRPLLYMTPRGQKMTQNHIQEWSEGAGLVILCGRYEGIDQRAIDSHQMQEISLGDYVLSGGEIPALVAIDACVRLLPEVVGNNHSLEEESFSDGLLEHPHYTRPAEWNGMKVPEILLSGHHRAIQQWRRMRSEEITKQTRHDLWEVHCKNKFDKD